MQFAINNRTMIRILIMSSLFLCMLTACTGTIELPKTEKADCQSDRKISVMVMSSNIRNKSTDAGDRTWDARKHAYIAMISDIQPDIVGMQEVSVDKQYEDLLLLTEYDRYRIASESYTGPETPVTAAGENIHGNVMIIWKKKSFEKVDAGHFWLGEKSDEPHYWPFGATDQHCRACIWVKLRSKANDSECYIFNTHYMFDPENKPSDFDENGNKKLNIEPRRKSSELLMSKITEIVQNDEAAVFLTGDFNCSLKDGNTRRGSYSLAPLTEYFWCALTDAAVTDGAISFNGFSDEERAASANIDYIFYRGAEALEYRTVTSPDYGVKWVSDHYPIVCSFKM